MPIPPISRTICKCQSKQVFGKFQKQWRAWCSVAIKTHTNAYGEVGLFHVMQYTPFQECCSRNSYQGQWHVIASHRHCGMQFLVPAIHTCVWHNTSPMSMHALSLATSTVRKFQDNFLGIGLFSKMPVWLQLSLYHRRINSSANLLISNHFPQVAFHIILYRITWWENVLIWIMDASLTAEGYAGNSSLEIGKLSARTSLTIRYHNKTKRQGNWQ